MSENPVEDNEILLRYKTAFDFWKLQCETQWRQFGAFILPHTLLIAFLLPQVFKDNPSHFAVISMAIVGLLLSVLWLIVHLRGMAWSNFRMKMARECERKLERYDFLTGRAEDFSKDKEVIVDTCEAKMPCYARVKTNNLTMYLIIIFLLGYLIIALLGLLKS